MVVLSICIPTYNRAEILDQTIKSIVSKRIFINTDSIEIIVSDNCSTDNTQIIVQKFVNQFPEKIKYFRNNTNIKDYNFEKVLSMGTGEFLKLNNDTLTYNDMALEEIITVIKDNRKSKRVIFFSNGALKTPEYTYLNSLNNFIQTVSYYSGWIGGFGIWKEDFDKIKDFNKYAHLHWAQLDVIYRIVAQKKDVLVFNKRLFSQIKMNKMKATFDFLTVYLENYRVVLQSHYNEGNISKKVFNNEKRNILINHISYNLAIISIYSNTSYPVVNNKFRRIIKSTYPDYGSICLFFVKYFFFVVGLFVKKTIRNYITENKNR